MDAVGARLAAGSDVSMPLELHDDGYPQEYVKFQYQTFTIRTFYGIGGASCVVVPDLQVLRLSMWSN
jgi:hypothetical protein